MFRALVTKSSIVKMSSIVNFLISLQALFTNGSWQGDAKALSGLSSSSPLPLVPVLNETSTLDRKWSLIDSGYVEVPDAGHTLWYEVHESAGERANITSCGSKTKKIPILYFHGGWGPLSHDLDVLPSETITDSALEVVYFHQRGWGKSSPSGAIFNNTMTDVVDDGYLMWKQFLSKERDVWSDDSCEKQNEILPRKAYVIGGSNGAALALKYAATYPETVLGVVLRGYWGMTPEQLEWNYTGFRGKRSLYPKEWKKVCDKVDCLQPLSTSSIMQDSNLLSKYYSVLSQSDTNPLSDCSGPSQSTKECEFACAYLRFDTLGSSVAAVPADMCPSKHDAIQVPDASKEWYQTHPVAAARIGLHLYLQDNQQPELNGLIQAKIPVHFVTGRFDFLCPPGFAEELMEQYQDLCSVRGVDMLWKATIVEHAAHSGSDPGMATAIQNAFLDMFQLQVDSVKTVEYTKQA